MVSLIESNPYVADPVKRRAMLVRSVLDSSRFEGIKGVARVLAQGPSGKTRAKASTSKRVKVV